MKALKDIDAIRERPGMYVGPIDDGTGLYRMVFEVADNAINEALVGYCSRIEVSLGGDGSVTVRDDGPGLRVDSYDTEGASWAEVIMTRLMTGRMFKERTEVPGRLDGVGVHAVNALSAWLDLRIWRDGREYFMRFLNGYPVAPLMMNGDSKGRRGTEISFLPDPAIFIEAKFDISVLECRFRDLEIPHAHATLVLVDNRGVGRREVVINL